MKTQAAKKNFYPLHEHTISYILSLARPTQKYSTSPMATNETTNMKWSRISDFLKEDSEIPTDIAFEIVDDFDTESGTVRAHKFILAAHSVFFRKAFFGTGLTFKEGTTGTVIVKETTKEAILTMIDFIYEKKINLANRTVEELFDILNISKRYQLDDLTLAINNHFKNFPFTLRVLDIWSRPVRYGPEGSGLCRGIRAIPRREEVPLQQSGNLSEREAHHDR